jgi:hypothetical protein
MVLKIMDCRARYLGLYKPEATVPEKAIDSMTLLTKMMAGDRPVLIPVGGRLTAEAIARRQALAALAKPARPSRA